MRYDKNYIVKPSVLIIVPIQHVTVVNPCNFNDNQVSDESLMMSSFGEKFGQWHYKCCNFNRMSQDVMGYHGNSRKEKKVFR